MSNRPYEDDDEGVNAWRLDRDTRVTPPWNNVPRNHSVSHANNGFQDAASIDDDVPSLFNGSETEDSFQDGMSSQPPSVHRYRISPLPRNYTHSDQRSSSPASHLDDRARSYADIHGELTDTADVWSRREDHIKENDVHRFNHPSTEYIDQVYPVSERSRRPYYGVQGQGNHTDMRREETGGTIPIPEREPRPYPRPSTGARQDVIPPPPSPPPPLRQEHLRRPQQPLTRTTSPHIYELPVDDDRSFISQGSSAVVGYPSEGPPFWRYPSYGPLPPETYHDDEQPGGEVRSNSPPLKETKHHHGTEKKGGHGGNGGHHEHGEKHNKERKKKDNWAIKVARFAVT